MPRFAILTHDYPELHWDFLLEKDAGLRTWRLQLPPDHAGGIPALPLSDHRRDYLDYEGPVSGGRGSVRQWDTGEFEAREVTDRVVRVRLQGSRLRGEASLSIGPSGAWVFTFVSDPASLP
jgi:hypothetical protein